MAERLVNTENAVRPGDGSYLQIIRDIHERGVCPFCPEHLADFHTNPILEETDHWLATDNMKPYPGTDQHMLFIHRNHIERIEDMTPDAWADLLLVVQGFTRAREIAGATMLFRHGETRHTGATVAHLHAQLISGSGNEPVVTRVG